MTTCLCGDEIEQEGALCPRCTALQTLGLAPGATPHEIEKTYRLLVKVWHPDRFQSDPSLRLAAEEKLKAINTAHTYLASLPNQARTSRPKPVRSTKRTRQNPAVVMPLQPAHRRTIFAPRLASNLATRFLLVASVLAVPVVLLLGADSFLSANAAAAGMYGRYRSQLLRTLDLNFTRTRQDVAQNLPHSTVPASTAESPGTTSAAQTASASDQQVANSIPRPNIPMPFVTVGLTRDEVIGVMGAPVSSTPDALTYGNAMFYFRNGGVTGWKIDPALIPLRVQLWPKGNVDPRITSFTTGSSRDVVLAVQGTPTLLSSDKLGYGASEVFLENGRVVGWNDNHASERLRIVPQ
ncbi:MAG: DnaJ domain-containing protein [Terracidiphilus sp.]